MLFPTMGMSLVERTCVPNWTWVPDNGHVSLTMDMCADNGPCVPYHGHVVGGTDMCP